MNKLDEQQKKISNQDVDWAKIYDFNEIELREMYRTVSKLQNESHFELLKFKCSKYLRKDKTFGEIGFSVGLTLRYALKYFGKVYGMDISPKNVELTTKELLAEGYTNFELHSLDLMSYDPKFENTFDVLSFIHGLEHFTADDYAIILTNIKKYLKPGGIFTGALPYKNQFNYRMCPNCSHVFELDGHVSSHDRDSLRKVFEKYGYTVVYLNNFNLKYALIQGGLLKKIYRYVYYHLLGKESNNQLEYIVMANR